MASREKPNFATELRNVEVFEGKGVHLEAKLTPQSDPNLRVDWFHNGRPLQMGKIFFGTLNSAQFLCIEYGL